MVGSLPVRLTRKKIQKMSAKNIDISICIVTFRARDYLQACLNSIYETTQKAFFEIIVVDNASEDGSITMIRNEFPDIQVIQNQSNEGFTRPTNQAMRVAQGRYILQLNPDTLIHPHALDLLIEFLDTHPEVGIAGPKVLNEDGTLQKPCRRSEARPWDVFTYFVGLANRFPHNKRFSGYYMGYMDENKTHEVHGVAGSCMLIRSEVIQQIGYLDERYFAYQEDADYCLQARRAGWKVYYYPKAQVTHFGGKGGSRIQPYRSIMAWHKSYYLYYRKNFAEEYPLVFNWLYYVVMTGKLLLALLKNLLSNTAFAGSRKPG